MKIFWKIRLGFQWLLTALGLNTVLSLVQFCDRCGKSGANWPRWWADTVLWEQIAGNVNGHHHGCFCPTCFTDLAKEKGIRIRWIPQQVKET